MLKEYREYILTYDTVRCLNPYFNGTCSKRNIMKQTSTMNVVSLNPYFNGTCSKSKMERLEVTSKTVS